MVHKKRVKQYSSLVNRCYWDNMSGVGNGFFSYCINVFDEKLALDCYFDEKLALDCCLLDCDVAKIKDTSMQWTRTYTQIAENLNCCISVFGIGVQGGGGGAGAAAPQFSQKY